MVVLLRLSDDFYVNPEYIIKVEIVSSQAQARANGIHFREQWVVDQTKPFTVSIHLRSNATNPDRFFRGFDSKASATAYINSIFGSIVTSV
jgi:hypothetical protein